MGDLERVDAPYEPGIEIIVVNYRTPFDLDDFCRSLEKFPPKFPSNLWIVNNAPLERDILAARDWIRALGGKHIVNRQNVGYATAVNDAVRRGSRSVIAIFNADIELSEHSLDECFSALQQNPDWGVLGPRQVNDNNRITAGGKFGSPLIPAERGFFRRDTGRFSDIRPDAAALSGSALFVKRFVWDQLTRCALYREAAPDVTGALLPTQHYYEDQWCCYHALKHGYKCVYYGPVKMIHKWHRASPRGSEVDEQIHHEAKKFFRRACGVHER